MEQHSVPARQRIRPDANTASSCSIRRIQSRKPALDDIERERDGTGMTRREVQNWVKSGWASHIEPLRAPDKGHFLGCPLRCQRTRRRAPGDAVRFLTACQMVCIVRLLRLKGPVMQRVTSREFQRNFGRFQDEALRAPLSITRNGRERLVLLSVEEYARLKRRDREALFVEELSEAEIEAIRRAEPSADAAQT